MKINVVLSGGGVRGFAHLGVIKALTEAGFDIKAISGTSSGAVTGAFIAAGYSPDETLKIMKDYNLFRLIRGSFSFGLFSMSRFEAIYRKYFPDDFSKLQMKLYISSTDLYSGTTAYFSEGPLIAPLVASTSIPVLFKPVKHDGRLLLDGGLLNNLPVEPFLESRLPILGVHVNPVAPVAHVSSTLKIMERSFNLAVYANIIERMKACEFVVEPPELAKYSVYAYSKANAIFEAGYEYAMQIMDRIIKQTIK